MHQQKYVPSIYNLCCVFIINNYYHINFGFFFCLFSDNNVNSPMKSEIDKSKIYENLQNYIFFNIFF